MTATPVRSVAEWIVEFLIARGVDRVFGLQGGHIQPIWDQLAQRGVRIVDVRDEGAAVHMAHAHAVLTGSVGVALVTAGSGRHQLRHRHGQCAARARAGAADRRLRAACRRTISGRCRASHTSAIMQPVTRSARTLRVADNMLRDLDKACGDRDGRRQSARARLCRDPDRRAARRRVPPELVLDEYLAAEATAAHSARCRPTSTQRGRADRPGEAPAGHDRPRRDGQRGASSCGFLDASGALYLDTQESRGLVPGAHPSFVGAVRARAMQEADLVSSIGRKLDYQTGYGSPAVFPNARCIRIADNSEELRENRRGEVELFAHPGLALAALAHALGKPRRDPRYRRGRRRCATSTCAAREVRRRARRGAAGQGRPHASEPHLRRAARSAEAGRDHHRRRRRHPELCAAGPRGAAHLPRRRAPSAASASACRTASPPRCCYPGPAGRRGHRRRRVRHQRDGDRHAPSATARRSCSSSSNNAAWNIERLDQEMNYGGRVVGTTLAWTDYAVMARAFGLHAERVTDPARLKAALRGAFANAPALIDVVVTQDALSSDAGKGLGWVPRLPGAHRVGRRRTGAADNETPS